MYVPATAWCIMIYINIFVATWQDCSKENLMCMKRKMTNFLLLFTFFSVRNEIQFHFITLKHQIVCLNNTRMKSSFPSYQNTNQNHAIIRWIKEIWLKLWRSLPKMCMNLFSFNNKNQNCAVCELLTNEVERSFDTSGDSMRMNMKNVRCTFRKKNP